MSTVIQLRGLRLMCIWRTWCTARGAGSYQPYEFDIDIHADVVAATHDDVLNRTIDYGAVLLALRRSPSGDVPVVRADVRRVGEDVLEDERIESVVVEVRKLRPPVAQDLASSGMRLIITR